MPPYNIGTIDENNDTCYQGNQLPRRLKVGCRREVVPLYSELDGDDLECPNDPT